MGRDNIKLETFFDNFELLADAPNGVQKLRELILQLAVQGKLVPQDPNDELASVLLEKIKAEKEQLIKEKKISKTRALTNIDNTEVPYKLPNSWKWVRLAQVVHDWGQKKPDLEFTYIDVSAINKEQGIISGNVNILQPNEAPSRARKIVSQGTVIYATVRPYLLNIAIVDKQFEPEPIVSTAFAVLHPFSGIFNKYLYYYLRSKPFIEYVEAQMKGMAYPAINDGQLYEGLVPLPPSDEQKRIVAKVAQLMALCDELEVHQQKRREGCVRINNGAIAQLLATHEPDAFTKHWQRIYDNFDLLYSVPENISKLRQAILQLAIQGKLVPQDPNDEPAFVLLEKVKAEKEWLIKEKKIRKSEPLPLIEADEIPFDLPNGWEWIRLGEIVQKLGAGSTPKGGKAVYKNSGIKFLRSQNVWSDGLRLDSVAHITPEIHQRMDGTVVEPGDILLNITGASIGRSAVVPSDFDEGNVSQHVAIIRLIDKSIRHYIHLCLISPLSQDTIMDVQVGISREGLSMMRLKDFLIPLPPFNETKRIAAKVDQLMALCDELEAKLIKSQTNSEKLINAAVRQVLVA